MEGRTTRVEGMEVKGGRHESRALTAVVAGATSALNEGGKLVARTSSSNQVTVKTASHPG